MRTSDNLKPYHICYSYRYQCNPGLVHWSLQFITIMLQPRICRLSITDPSISSLASSLTALTLCSTNPSLTFNRHASHAAQGRANGPKDSAGRRLGAKKTASQWVIPGNIIFKQRGKFTEPKKLLPVVTSLKLTKSRHQMASRRKRRYRQRPHHLRHRLRLCALLPRSSPPP